MSWLAALRCVHLVSSALVAGAIAFELLVLRRAAGANESPDLVAQVRQWLRTLALAGIVAGLLSWLAWLAEVAIGMTGLPAAEALAPVNLGVVVTRTTFGHAWVLRTILLLLLWPLFLRRRGGSAVRAGKAVGATVLVGSLAWTGHAVASHPLHVWVDAAHLGAAALWVGMLPPLWLLLRHACRAEDGASMRLAGRAARFFSPAGVAAVTVLACTGALSSWWLVGTPAGLVHSRYGLLLSAKLALFAVMLALAASNRMVLSPRLDRPSAARAALVSAAARLRRNVLAEMLLALAVLALVGVLGVTPPAAHEGPMHHQDGHEGHAG